MYEPYFGAVKGAAKTLNDMTGNDVDLASALISVYREAGIPCRYVYGTIQLTSEQAASWLGVDASQVDALLSENHIPYKHLGTPGIGDILIDHVWVKAYVDYLPYHGATEVVANDNLEKVGDTWIEIDPSFKQHEFSTRRDMEAELGIQSGNFLTNIRSQTSRGLLPDNAGIVNTSNGDPSDDNVTLLPQTFILNEVIGLANPLAQFLAQNHLTTATVFRQRTIKEESYGLLPVTDFYKIHARGLSFSTFPEALTTTVHLTIDNVAGQEVLNFDSSLTELLTSSLSLSYNPATPEDTAIVNAWSDTPGESVAAYDVDVIPQLSIDGTIIATGSIMDTLGSAHTLNWTILPAGANPAYFTTPDASLPIESGDIVNAGSLNTFVFDAGTVTDSEISTIRDQINNVGGAVPSGDNPPPPTTRHQLTNILRATGLNYFYQADRFAQITGGVLDLYAQRTPSLIRVSYGLEVDELFGLPYTATAKTVKTSVVHDTFTLTPISATDPQISNLKSKITNLKSLFTHVNALTSSALGANSLQQFFQENSVSSARLFQVASNTTNPVYTLKPDTDPLGNPLNEVDADVFATLNLTISPATQQLIVDMLNRGWTLTFTRDPVLQGGLTRDPVLAVDPLTGDSGFFLFAPGYQANLIAGSELQFNTPPITFKQLLNPSSSAPLPSSLVANATEWLYALPGSTTNSGIAFLPAIAHIKNFLSLPPDSSSSDPRPSLQLSSLKTVAASIALIGRIDEISNQPGIVDVAIEPDFISPNNDGIQDVFTVNAITTRTASWNIRFANSLGDPVRELTAVDNLAPDVNNSSRINIQWDGADKSGELLPDDTYAYVITAQGAGGATYSSSMVIDATAPTANLTVETTPLTGDTTLLEFKGTADDTNLNRYTITIKDNSTGEVVLIPFNTNLPVINSRFGGISSRDLENGTYVAELTVEDRAGNTASVQSQTLIIDNPVLDRTPPEITVVSPLTDPEAGVLNGLVPVSVNAFDESGIAKIEVVIDNLVVDKNTKTATLNTEIDLSKFADGVHTFKVAVTDNKGNQAITDESTFLSSTSGPDLRPPTLTLELPDTTQTLTPPIPLTAVAEDNDLLQSIGVVLDDTPVAEKRIAGTAPTGSLTHDLDAAAFIEGTHTLIVQATDLTGNTGEKTLVIPAANDHESPQLSMQTSVDSATGPYRGDVDIRVTASDDQILRQILLYVDGILVESVTAPSPLSATDRSSQFNATLLASDLLDGDHIILAKAVDAAGNISTTAPVNFTSSNPIANFSVSPSLVRPGLPTGARVTVTATLQTNTNWTITTSGPSAVADITGNARQINQTINAAGLTDGEYTVTIDADGVLEQPSANFIVDLITGPTIAEIANVSENQLITDGLFDLRGAADDPDSTDAISYKITVHDKSNGALIRNVTPGPVNPRGFRENRVPATGSFGMVDFTMVENGIYDLRLTVKGGADVKTRQVRIILNSDLKVGQFSFSQQDMIIPVNGQPLSVIRTYNSLNPKVGDFGHSWTWSITDVDMELDEERNLVDGDEGLFSQRVGGGRNVTLTLPDGRRTTFQFTLESAGRFKHRAKWTAPPGVYATLQPIGSSELITLLGLQYWQAAGPDTPLDYYDFPGFILTMEDGSQYLIEREDTGFYFVFDDIGNTYSVQTYGEATLRRITQRSGDRIEFNPDRIDHFDATGVNTKSIVFQRNGQGRINAIFDPIGLDANGQPIGPAAYTYEYDAIGNLIKVNRLVDKTNTVYETTTFIYSNPNFPHYITEIQDPRGISPMKNEYDDSGRLVGVIDGFGHRITLDHDIAANTETIYDRGGNATIHVYDNRGNVISTTDSLGKTIKRSYDDDNNETSITDPLGNITRFTYDTKGNRTSVMDPLGNTTRFTYDNFGNQLSVADPLGYTTTNQYDGKGNLVATTNALGQTTRNTYDSRGNLTSARDALGNTTATFGYDISGNLTGTTDAFGFARAFTYDSNGNQTGASYEWINPDDGTDIRTVTTRTVYNAAGQVVSTLDPENNETQTVYNLIGKPIETTDKLGNTTRTTYDARGNVIETQFPDGTLTRTAYDANGRALVTTDRYLPDGPAPVNGSRTLYDAAGRVVRSERLGDVVIDIVDDGNDGSTSKFITADRVISATESVYDAAGRVIESINADDEVTRFEYDDAGRQIAVIDTLSNRTEFEYDPAGRQILVRDALGRETEFEYDALGRRTRTIFPPTNVGGGTIRRPETITTYNQLGQRIAETDQNGITRNFEYDQLGRLTAVVLPEVPDPEDADNSVRPRYEYDYDTYGRLTTIRDPKGRETHFSYDELGRQLTRTLPLDQSECQSYNSLGQLEFKADFKGQVTEFLYDALGRVQEKRLYAANNNVGGGVPTGDPCDATTNLPSTPDETITYIYDELGRQAQITENVGGGTTRRTSFGYDPDGRLISLASPEGKIFYEYDPITGRKDRTFTANSDILYDYDPLGRLAAVTVLKQNGAVLTDPDITTYDYNDVGSQSAITYPNNTQTTYTYDSLNRLTELVNQDLNVGGASSPRLLSSYSYSLAPNGRRTGVTEIRLESNDTYSSTGITYTYDKLNRLTREAAGSTIPEPNFNTNYTYDLVGNRISKASNDGKTTEIIDYSFNANDQLTTETKSSAGSLACVTGYTYDPNGSLISKTVTPDPSALSLQPAAYSYTYNLKNRLASALISRTENDQDLDIVTNYLYNQSGIRVKANSTVTNHTTSAIFDNNKTFLIDPNNHTGYAQVLEEYDNTSGTTPTVSYTLGNDVISQATAAGTDVLMYDGHGSTRLLTDSSATITDRMSYDAYGMMLRGNPTNLEPTTTNLLYSGEQFDVDLQQQYLRARWYDQNDGRFNRLDPFFGFKHSPMSLNKYLYVNGDPVNNLDPSGKVTLTELTSNIGTIMVQFLRVAKTLSNAFDTINTALTWVNTASSIARILNNPADLQAWNDLRPDFLDHANSDPTGFGRIKSGAFWNDSFDSFRRYFLPLSNELRKWAKSMQKTLRKRTASNPFQFVIQLPTPLIGGQLVVFINSGFKITFGTKKGALQIPVVIQAFGKTGGGRTLGFGYKLKNSSVQQFFRQDWHSLVGHNPPGNYPTQKIWLDNRSRNPFHYHVRKPN